MPRLSGSWRLELRYCMKVGIAAGLGYALLGLITPAVAERFGIRPVTK